MSIRFDGTHANHLERTTDLLDANSAYTVVGWARRQVDRNAFSTVWSIDDTVNTLHTIQTQSNGDSLRGFCAFSDTATVLTLVNGNWFRWALSYNGTNSCTARAAEVGSALTSASATAADMAGPDTMFIGTSSFSEPFNGDICYVKAWSAELTVDEIEQELARVVPTRSANLYGWWPLISAADVRDYSGNGRDWTVAGTLADADSPPVTWMGMPIIVVSAAAAAGPNPFEDEPPPVAIGQPWMQNTVIYG